MLTFEEVQKEYNDILSQYDLSIESNVWGYILFSLMGQKIEKRPFFKSSVGENYFRLENITVEEAQACEAYLVDDLKVGNVILMRDFQNTMEDPSTYNKFYFQFNGEIFHKCFRKIFREFLEKLDTDEIANLKIAASCEPEVNNAVNEKKVIVKPPEKKNFLFRFFVCILDQVSETKSKILKL